MFSICRQTHPATAIEHAVSCCFFNSDETCLVTAGANIMKVFRLMPEGDSTEKNAAGQIIPPKMRLECLANYTLWGGVMSLQTVKVHGTGRDLLLISLREAKLAVLQYDPNSHDLATLSLHYFEEEDMKDGFTDHNHIPMIRVDPENRCAVMLLYGRKLAVLPFRKETNTEDRDTMEAKPLDVKNPQPVSSKAPVMASYVIVLKDLDEKLDNILDIQFLHGYYEPTLLFLYEPIRTFPGRIAVRTDTCAMVSVSLNVQQRVHPVIWSTSGLPFDCLQAVAIEKPLGGCLMLAVNSLIYLNQSVPPFGVSLNSAANLSTNFPLKILDGVCISLDAACVVPLVDSRLVISLKGGQLYVVNLIADSVRSVRAIHLDRAAASVLTTCMCLIEEDFLFLGSRLGNSLLLRVTDRENRILLSVDRPLETTVDLTGEENEKEDESDAAKRRRVETLAECAATDVLEIIDQDELEVYGSDRRMSTQLTSYVFEVCDSILNIGPISNVSMGEPALLVEEPHNILVPSQIDIELVTTSGHGKNGALCVLQRTIRPQVVTSFHLPGCLDMWTVLGESPESTLGRSDVQDADGFHSYLLLTQEDATMVLQTGQEINEVDTSGFSRTNPTVFAANLGNNKYAVQVTTGAVRLVRANQMLQHVTLDFVAASASVADPYLCVVSTCGRTLVMALRELKGSAHSARLAPTRQAVPSRPSLLKACAYRDLSGLFTTLADENIQVKGEFTGKKGKNVKSERVLFDPNKVYDVNDEDEVLYGGDQTLASMATLMQEERSGQAKPPRRLSRWWRRHLMDKKPTYWLFVVRKNGNLEIYSLPDMRLSFLTGDIVGGAKILADSLESVSMLVGLTEGSTYEETEASRAAGAFNIPTTGDVNLLKEILVIGLGNKGSRPLMLLRLQNELLVYQVYRYPRGNLKMRFRRMELSGDMCLDGQWSPNTDENEEVMQLRDNVKQMRYFNSLKHSGNPLHVRMTPLLIRLFLGLLKKKSELDSYSDHAVKHFQKFIFLSILHNHIRALIFYVSSNIAGYNGVYICGERPVVLVLSARGELRRHAIHTAAGPAIAQAPFNNANCPNGFLYFNDQSELRICVLPTHLLYDAVWPVRKVPLRMSPQFVTYHVESKTYCLIASQAKHEQSYYKFNGEDKELSVESSKGERFPYPLQDRFSIMLFSPVSWDIIPNSKIELDEWEHVTCLKNVSLSYEGTRSGLRGYIVLGTNYNYSEDITSRGRILIYDIIDVVPEPGQPLTKNKFKEIYAKEQKGPVTALAQVVGFLISAVGQKIYIWQLKDDDLVGVAFIDTQVYVHRIMAVKNLILIADVYKSISLLRFQEQHRTLSLVSRDIRDCQVYDMEFLVDNSNLGFFISESEGNFVLFMYQPQARESFGGQRLIRKGDFHLGQQVNAMFRLGCKINPEQKSFIPGQPSLEKRHLTMFATLDGGIGYVMPVSEKSYRRLLMLQNVLNNYCCHLAGLNPKAFRTYKSARRIQGGPARGILDGDLVYQFTNLPNAERQEVAKKIGTKVEEILADLSEIEKLTGHF